MTQTYQIPKDRTRVVLQPPGLETSIFLSRSAAHHEGNETIHDLLEDEAPFLPTHGEDGFAMIRKDLLSWVRIVDPFETDEGFFEEEQVAHRLAVRILFADGSKLVGDLVVVTPESGGRVSDVVNSNRRWVHFEDERHHYLVQLRRIARIVLPDETRDS